MAEKKKASKAAAEGGVSKEQMAAAGNAALGDSIAVLVKPDEAIPKVVNASGFMGPGIIAGAYVILMTLFFLFGVKVLTKDWPDLEEVLRELFGQVVLVGLLAGGVFACANHLFDKKNIGLDKALNTVAAALVPVIVVALAIFVLRVVWAWPLAHMASLQTVVLVIYLLCAIQSGLGLKPGAALFTTVVTFLVANFIYTLISDAWLMDTGVALMQQMQHEMQSAFEGF